MSEVSKELKKEEELEQKVEAQEINLEDSKQNSEQEEVNKEAREQEDSKKETLPVKKVKDELKEKLDNTKAKVEETYAKYEALDKKLEETIASLIEQENEIIKNSISTSLELLKELQVDSLDDEEATIKEIELDNKEEKIDIKEPSKGIFKGIVFGSIAMFATVAASFAIGAKMSNIAINAQTILDKANWDKVASYFSKLLNINTTPTAGYLLIGASSILIGLIVYKLTTWLQKLKNNRYINKLEQDVEEYSTKLQDKMEKMKELIEHAEHIKLVMQKYDIILQEQNAKIRRMLFIEQPESVDDLQRASKLEVDKTILILDELLKLMNTPVNEGVEITPDSKERLKSANSVINEVIKKLYV